MAKFVFTTGGVLSSLGKGITAASVGALLESRGYKVTIKKYDPYLNVDPGTMSPFQHGEVFVTEDGAETDLDLGHYERYLSTNTSKVSNITAGKIYKSVLDKERNGDYLGGTVQVIPHITDEIKANILKEADNFDIVIVEIGGTVGDIESLPFLEAIRQFKFDYEDDVCYMHLTLVPYIKSAGELKTKPTQHSVKTLREIGIQPDVLVCRSEMPIDDAMKKKIGLFCNVPKDAVINALDANTIYEVPIMMREQGIAALILKRLGMDERVSDISKWEEIVQRIKKPEGEVTIGLVGKYVDLKDAYISINEALIHGGIANKLKVNVKRIDAEDVEAAKNMDDIFEDVDGILIPGGFGERGTEGKIRAINFARLKDIPCFGICLGLQLIIVEFARNVLKLEDAHSVEFDADTSNPVIDYMNEQKNITQMGGTMRLGAYDCTLDEDSTAFRAYGEKNISERHRHRLEFNNDFKEAIVSNGLSLIGVNEERGLAEMFELKSNRWFLGCQFHPEFKSKPFFPHPLFKSFIEAANQYHKDNKEETND